MGRYEESTEYYRQFIELDDDNALAYSYIGENYELMGDIQVAGDYFKFAMEHSDSGYLKLRYSAYLFSIDRLPEALPYFKEGWKTSTDEERDGFASDFGEMMRDPVIKSIINE